MEELARKGVAEVWLNPGADDDEVVERAEALGLNVIQACSIIAIGESPAGDRVGRLDRGTDGELGTIPTAETR